MKAPTTEEIQAAYEAITRDGPGARITQELSMLTIQDPILKGVVNRMASCLPADDLTRGVISGALIYGLHMALYIGEARGGKS